MAVENNGGRYTFRLKSTWDDVSNLDTPVRCKARPRAKLRNTKTEGR